MSRRRPRRRVTPKQLEDYRHRPSQKVDDDALRAFVRDGLPYRQIAARMGLPESTVWMRARALGLVESASRRFQLKATDGELLALCRQGLWPREIAARTGMTYSGVVTRLRGIRRRGVLVPKPVGARPNPRRRASDDQIIALARSRLRTKAIARRLGLSVSGMEKRLASLRRRGLLPAPVVRQAVPPGMTREERNREVLALCAQGLWPHQIAARLGLSPNTVRVVVHTLRRRGLLPPAPADPRRNGSLRMPEEQLLACVRGGMEPAEIVAQFGVRKSWVYVRLSRLRRRGVLPPAPPRRPPPTRPRISDEALIVQVKMGLRPDRIAARVGLRRATVHRRIASLRQRGLLPSRPQARISDAEFLAMRRAGLWPSQIAERTGVPKGSIGAKLQRLRRAGVAVPRPAGPRPNSRRRASDKQLLDAAHAGLRIAEIGARVGLSPITVAARLRRLGRAGVAVPRQSRSRISDEELVALARTGIPPAEIATRAGLSRGSIYQRFTRLRRQGRLPPSAERPPLSVRHKELLDLVGAGLGRGEIARRLGVTPVALKERLRGLRRRGVVVPACPRSRVRDEDLLTLARDGCRPRDIAARVGLSRSRVEIRLARLRERGLLPPQPPRQRFSDDDLLAALRAGLRTGEIAHRFGVSRSGVEFRMRGLRQRGVSLPPRPRPAPPNRRVTDEEMVAFVREGLSSREMAARLRMRLSHVQARLAGVRRRGLLSPARQNVLTAPAREERDRQMLALHQSGLLPEQIASRLGLKGNTVSTFLYRLRRRGLLPAVPVRGAAPRQRRPIPPNRNRAQA